MLIYEQIKEIIGMLTEHYHKRGAVHGGIIPETILNLQNTPPLILPVPFRHPDILLSGQARTKEHDYYALLTTVVYINRGKVLNSPDCPITGCVEMRSKVELFHRYDTNGDRDKGIDYLFKLYIGEVLATPPPPPPCSTEN